jgi:aryl-phospho-beta-D-glucosidase BglC (GH1 family)
MHKCFSIFSCVLLLLICGSARAGFIYQNFEPDNGSPLITTSIGRVSIYSVDRTEGVHLGIGALKYESPDYWTGFGVQSQISSTVDLKQNNNDRLTFWTLAFPQRNCYVYGCDNGTDNNVGVRFYDQGQYAQNGFEVWTTNTAKYDQWSKLWVLFSQLPPDFDLAHVTRIEFRNYWPGKYYFDDIHAVREDHVYQSFEKENRSGSTDGEYGWKWNDVDTAATSTDGEPAYQGKHSWKLITVGNWGGTGLQSQEKRFLDLGNGNTDQSFWNVDLNPEVNDRLTLWVYALPQNGMDNNLSVQFYDDNHHATDETKAVAWTKDIAHYGEWTRLSVLFKDLPMTLDLHNLNKIQIQHYWPGTFYVDEIKATGPYPVLKEKKLSQGIVEWTPVSSAENYRLQESVAGPAGPWVTIYSGVQPSYTLSNLSKRWLRVRWEEAFEGPNSLPYASDWSDVVEYNPPSVFLKYRDLQSGKLNWSAISQPALYEIEKANTKNGPWQPVYKGSMPAVPILASLNQWYRIRAIQEANGMILDATPWSRPQKYLQTGKGYVKASGLVLKDADGAGDELVLKGVNLGNEFVIEDWMTGIGYGDSPLIPDDWTVREVLTSRFGAVQANVLLKTFQDAYLQSYDFDRLLEMGLTVARLPIYYRNLQDDNGNWILNANGQIDFSAIDRIVDELSNRGIYTIVDLHGAPGAQNVESHSGRKDFNKLFEASSEGQAYRNRTVEMWREMAKHFKNNTWVVGYDLLNEPLGAPTPQILWDLYDRLYDAIRNIDNDHLIMMEGIWDWDTLPVPASMNWQNVLYQFHYYYWGFDEDVTAHKAFLDSEIAKSLEKQPLYNVPVMIGEFNGFLQNATWNYYIQKFKAYKWSWAVWAYKMQSTGSNWGLYNQAHYDEDLPKLRTDSYDTLMRKLSKYSTVDYHLPNVALINLIKEPIQSLHSNALSDEGSQIVSNQSGMFTLTGTNLGDTPGTVSFYSAPCNDYPPGSIACNNGEAGITFWSNALVKGYIPPDAADLSRYSIHSTFGGELYPTMMGGNDAPVLNPIGDKTVNEGNLLTFNIQATDFNGDALTFSAINLPDGASLNGQTFSWRPAFDQSGIYSVIFKVTDGITFDEEAITITVNNVAFPDLKPVSISGPLSTFTRSNISINTTIMNGGDAPSGVFYVGIYLSPDSVITTNDIRVDTRYVSSLLAHEIKSFSGTTFISNNFPPGTYYIGAIVDYKNDRIEADETNNALAGNKIIVSRREDLVMTAVSGPSAAFRSSTVQVTNAVQNQGLLKAGSFSVGIYLSTDNVITTADRRMESRPINSLDAGESNTKITNVRIPSNLPPGQYFWGAIADYFDSRVEQDETNNALTGNSVLIK